MNFAERNNAIGELLKDEILPRYTRPEHLDDDAARRELADMVADLNSEWPVMGLDAFRELGVKFAANIRKLHTSRRWPTIALMLKALSAAQGVRLEAAKKGGEHPGVYDLVVDWWKEYRSPLPSTAHDGHAERMVADRVATWGELFRAGFPIAKNRVEQAKAEFDPRHAEILAGIMADAVARYGGGDPSAAPEDAKHWTETAKPDDPRYAALKEARAKANALHEATR